MSLESAAFSKGAQQAQVSLKGLNTAVQDTARNVIVQSATIIGGFVKITSEIKKLMRETFQDIKQLDQIGQATGIGITALSELKGAVELAGASFNSLKGAIETWQGAMADANRGDLNTMSQNLLGLGLSLRDAGGEFVDFNTLLGQVADKVAGASNGMQQAKIVTDLFGKGAADLVPFFAKGSASIDELKDKARELGLVLDATAGERAKEYAESVKTLQAAWSGFGMSLALVAAGPVKAVVDALQALGKSHMEDIKALDISSAKANWDAAAKTVDMLTGKIAAMRQQQQDMQALWDSGVKSPDLFRQIRDGNAELEIFQKRLTDAIATAQGAEQTFNATRVGQFSTVTTEAPSIDPDQQMIIRVIKEDLEMVQEKLAGMPIMLRDSFDFDTNPFTEAMERVENAVEQEAMTRQQAQRMKMSLARQEQNAILDTASVVGNSLTQVFRKSKLAAAAQAAINTAVGVTKALAQGGMYGWIQAAAITAAGIAQIAAINSSSETGGASAPASPSSGSGGDGGSSTPTPEPQSRTLYIEGINPMGMFSGPMVRELIERMNQEVRDGAVIVVK